MGPEGVPEFAEIDVPLDIREISTLMTCLSVTLYYTRTSEKDLDEFRGLMTKLMDVARLLPEEDLAALQEEYQLENLFIQSESDGPTW
jgi:hypothetical protein